MEIEDQQGKDVCQVSDMSSDEKEPLSLMILQVYKEGRESNPERKSNSC